MDIETDYDYEYRFPDTTSPTLKALQKACAPGVGLSENYTIDDWAYMQTFLPLQISSAPFSSQYW